MFSRTFTRSVSSLQESRVIFDDFIKFVKTSHELRPFIYRKKNANRLLAMDLKDPETKLPVQPRQPVKRPGSSIYNSIVLNSSSSQELESLIQEFKDITPRKKEFWSYFKPSHLQNMLIVSTFKFGTYSRMLNTLYQLQPLFVKAKQVELYDVESWFNTVLMCQLHRNQLENVKNKEMVDRGLKKLLSTVTKREDTTGLSGELLAALSRQQDVRIKSPNFVSDINLPTVDLQASKVSQLLSFISNNRPLYLLARTAVEFGSTNPKVQQFVSSYQDALKQLNKTDIYDEYVQSYKAVLEAKTAQPQQTDESAPTPESKTDN